MIKIIFIIVSNFSTLIVMGQISATKFAEYWIKFIDQEILNQPKWITLYNSDKLWTDKILGNKKSGENDSPFGEFIKAREELKYRKEDGSTDLSFFPNNLFKNVYTLHENESEREDIFNNKNFYPTYYHILIEHENNIYRCYEEMAKLAYLRARLKVLITYNENVEGIYDYKYINEILINNFSEIIKQSNINYPENDQTEYLLIIGQIENNKLNWYNYIFDMDGRQTIKY